MSIRLSAESQTGSIWSTKAPTPKSNGLLMDVTQTPGQPEASFTTFAFNPFDNTRFCFGDSVGTVYHVLMKKNRFVVAARLPLGMPVTSMAFISAHVLLAASGMQLFVVDLEHGRVDGRGMKTPHNNNIVGISVFPVRRHVAVTYSVDAIALWKTAPLQCTHNSIERGKDETLVRMSGFIGAAINDDGVLITVEEKGFLTIWCLETLQPLRRVDIAPHKPTSLSIGASFAAVGTKNNRVLCLSITLDGISAVTLPGSSGVRSLAIISNQLLACQLNDGHVWFVSTDDYAVRFSLSHPSLLVPRSLHATEPTYAAVVTNSCIFLYHLPTAKGHYQRTISGTSAQGSLRSQTSLYPFVKDQRKERPSNAQSSSTSSQSTALAAVDANTLALPRQPLAVAESAANDWIKVNLISSGREASHVSTPQTLMLRDAVRATVAAETTLFNDQHSAVSGACSLSRGPKSAGGVSTTTTAGGRVSGDASRPRTAKSSGRPATTTSSGAAANERNSQSEHEGVLAAIALRGPLDYDSRVVNMDKLRSLLLRYGTFPERYRPLIWRFLLQLPEKRLCESQFVNLTLRGPHPAVKSLMQPYPLPETKLRNILYNTLSALAWHSPVFSAVHNIPNMLFPFVKLFSSDVQSAVEVFLQFMHNWGREFFKYYRHPPVGLQSLIAHTLKMECEPLFNHFEAHGVGADVFVWDVLSSIYTEVLTRNEWLQTMDHAFANEPLWLFLFHVAWLTHLKRPLMELHDHASIVAALRRAAPVNINVIIQNTYALQCRYMKTDLSEPYCQFLLWENDTYPPVMECNEAVITSKIRELEKIQAHETNVLNMRDRITRIKQQLAQAAMLESAFINKQKAVVASKFEASNDVWVQQVQLEKERQRLRDIEHETRLAALQEQVRSAQRIEDLQSEIQAASSSARAAAVDRQREVMKWDFADRMANQEIERLEAGARMKLTSMIASTEAMAQRARDVDAVQNNSEHSTSIHQSPIDQSDMSTGRGEYANGINRSRVHVPPPPPPAAGSAYPMEDDAGGVSPASELADEIADEEGLMRAASASNAAAATPRPENPTPPTTTATTTSASNITTSTSSNTNGKRAENGSSSCASDPVRYYDTLQEEIRRNVEAAQRQSQDAISKLNSRYARALLQDETGTDTDVTEPVVDDDEEYGWGHHQHHYHYNSQTSQAQPSSHHNSQTGRRYSDMYRDSRGGGGGALDRFSDPSQRDEEGSVDATESTQSSSMTRAILRPHRQNFFSSRD